MMQFFESSKYKKIFWIVVGLYMVFAVFMVFRSSTVGIDGHRYFSLFDDAMISMRYADNLVEGKGLVWNPGERVEGFSSPLLVFFMALAVQIFGKIYGVLAIQLLGVILLAVNIFLVLKIIHYLLKPTPLKNFINLMATLFLITFYPLFYWSVMGMDTGLLTTLVLLAFFILVKERATQKINIWLPIILSLCYLTRPESILFILVIYSFKLFRNVRNFRFLVGEIFILLIPVALYHLFRWQYYHQFYPNTYFLKATGLTLSQRLRDGFAFFYPFLMNIQLIVFWIFMFFVTLAIKSRNNWKTLLSQLLEGNKNLPFGQNLSGLASRYYILVFLTLFIVFAVYQLVIGGDAWPRYWRFTVPYTVLLFLAFLFAVLEVKEMLKMKNYFFHMVTILVFVFGLFFTAMSYHADFLLLRPNQSGFNESHINTAIVLKELITHSATITNSFAGVIPYYTGLKAYDPLGRVDPYIARLVPDTSGALSWGGMKSVPGHNKYDLNYTFKKLEPDVIIPFGSWCRFGRQNLEDWCRSNYELVNYKGVELLLKKNSPYILWEKTKRQ